jgi:hypothetical protein
MHPETTALFGSKHPHHTNWLELAYPEDHPPTELIEALRAVGWQHDGFPDPPPLNGIMNTTIGRRGTSLFGGWQPEERKQFMREARAVLRRFGFTGVSIHKYTFQELI